MARRPLPPPDAAIVLLPQPGLVAQDWYDFFRDQFGIVSLFEATTTVTALPTAGTAGRRRFVTDATAATFASIVAGGGTNRVPVYDDGTNWRIG